MIVLLCLCVHCVEKQVKLNQFSVPESVKLFLKTNASANYNLQKVINNNEKLVELLRNLENSTDLRPCMAPVGNLTRAAEELREILRKLESKSESLLRLTALDESLKVSHDLSSAEERSLAFAEFANQSFNKYLSQVCHVYSLS